MSASAIEGISHDVWESGDEETNGLLLGRREIGECETVWIEHFERLDAAPEVWPRGTVGFYRGTTSQQGFPESEPLPDGLFLEILAGDDKTLTGQFFISEQENRVSEGPKFPFLSPAATTPSQAIEESPAAHARPRRLVPDFAPADEQQPVHPREFTLPPAYVREEEPNPDSASFLRKAAPLLGSLLLIGSAVWFLPRLMGPSSVAPLASASASPRRPLGLYVDPSGPAWRISWNRDASILQGARSVRLFIHEVLGPAANDQASNDQAGADQNGADLTPKDLDSGMYSFTPAQQLGGVDVTFRLEATGPDGNVSAETFRLVRTAIAAPPPAAPQSRQTPPKAIHRVAPVIPSSIRPRIRGKVAVDIRVQIDPRGSVASAKPLIRPRSPLESELIKSALKASRQWRFEPATRDGKPITGTQTLHFVFE